MKFTKLNVYINKTLLILNTLLILTLLIPSIQAEEVPLENSNPALLDNSKFKAGLDPAAEEQTDQEEGSKLPFSFDASISLDVVGKKNDQGEFRENIGLREIMLSIEVPVAEKISVVTTAYFEVNFVDGGRKADNDLGADDILYETYLKIGDEDLAGLIGRHIIAFGQENDEMPVFTEDLLYDAVRMDAVWGATISAKLQLANLIDRAEASIFSSEQYARTFSEGEFGEIDAVSVRLMGEVLKNVRHQVSYMHAGRKHLDDADPENRVSIGFTWQDPEEENRQLYVQGLISDQSLVESDVDNFRFGLIAGAILPVGPGEVVTQLTVIPEYVIEPGVGYRWRLSKNVSIRPELRYQFFEDKAEREDGVVAGARFQIDFGSD